MRFEHTMRKHGIEVAVVACLVAGGPAQAQERTYSTDADFDAGTLQQLQHDTVHDQLQLAISSFQQAFVWIPNTSRGTLARLDAATGAVLGEYRSAPDGFGRSPSRTAVDAAGNVWAGNFAEASGGRGSVVQIGLVLGGTRGRKGADGSFTPDPLGEYLAPPYRYSTAVDRDGDGLIRTSRGLGHILPWIDLKPVGMEADAASMAAEDECIRLFQRTSAPNVDHVSIAPQGHVWVGGSAAGTAMFDELDGATGDILRSLSASCGGHGGVIDAAGVLWSSSPSQNRLLRLDTRTGDALAIPVTASWGVTLDEQGFILNSMSTQNQFTKVDADGQVQPGYPKASFGSSACGIVVTPGDGDVWIANYGSINVARVTAAGVLRKRINVGNGPRGIGLDAAGKLWVTNQLSNSAMRIDPRGGSDGLGAVDLAVMLGSGAGPNSFGSMTGAVQGQERAEQGTWTVVHDGGAAGVRWSRLVWHGEEPAGTRIAVAARAADDVAELVSAAWLDVDHGADLRALGLVGRHVEMRVTLRREAGSDAMATPVLHDLTILANTAPECAAAQPSVDRLWPPNGRLVPVTLQGFADLDGDALQCRIVRITQDEPPSPQSHRGGRLHDAEGLGTETAWLRAERDGEGNGRVYVITFVASDGRGGECEGRVTVCVPHDQGQSAGCVDDGQLWDSMVPREDTAPVLVQQYPNPFNPTTTIEYSLAADAPVRLVVYDAAGRQVRLLDNGLRPAGLHSVVWDGRNDAGLSVTSGLYLLRVVAGARHEVRRMLLVK